MAVLLIALLATAVSAQERVYLTEEDALGHALRGAVEVRQRVVTVGPGQARILEEETGARLLDSVYVFHDAIADGVVQRSAVIMNVLGQYQPITFYAAISPGGSVERVEIMVYRESRGGEVRRGAFLKQFNDKTVADPLRTGDDVMNITGATISSRAISCGVRLALKLHAMLDERAAPPGQ